MVGRVILIPAQPGGRRRQKGLRMVRKTSIILLGATAGAAITLLAVQPHLIFTATSADAAMEDTYRQLNLFGDVFERVRTDYVEVPDDGKLIESAINGMLAGLDPHSSYMNSDPYRKTAHRISLKYHIGRVRSALGQKRTFRDAIGGNELDHKPRK